MRAFFFLNYAAVFLKIIEDNFLHIHIFRRKIVEFQLNLLYRETKTTFILIHGLPG
jgi:hypothetical protein